MEFYSLNMLKIYKYLVLMSISILLLYCNRDFQNPVDPTVHFPGPMNLSLHQISDNSVQLSWIYDLNIEKGFVIERKIEDQEYTEVLKVEVNKNSCIDESLIINKRHTYRVKAYIGDKDSEPSNEISFINNGIGQPTNFSINILPGTDETISLSWEDNSNVESGFRIDRKIDNNAFSEYTVTSSDITSYNLPSSLLDSTYDYQFRIVALRDSISSLPSDSITIYFQGLKIWSRYHEGFINKLFLNSDFSRIYGSICAWDSKTGALLWKGKAFGYDLKLSNDDKYIVSAGTYSSGIMLWNCLSGNMIWEVKYTKMNEVNFSPDNQKIVSTGFSNGFMNIWETKTGNMIWENRDHVVKTAIFSNDNQLIYSGGISDTLKVWNSNNGDIINKKYIGGIIYRILTVPNKDVIIISTKSDIYVINSGNMQTIWSASNLEEIKAINVSSNGKLLMTGGNSDFWGNVWDMETGNLLWQRRHYDKVNSISFSKDNSMVATSCYDDTLRIFKAKTGELLWQRSDTDDFLSCKFSPNGKNIVSGNKNGNLTLWNLTKWAVLSN